ncbi:MAG: hypothetical protein AAFU64_01575, partial [Bacteroidota bacterium]
MILLKIGRLTLIFLFLTLISQLGGVIYLIYLIIRNVLFKNFQGSSYRRLKKTGLLLSVYLLFTQLLIPPLARINHRVPLPLWASEEVPLQAAHPFYYFFMRNYIRPKLKEALIEIAHKMRAQYPGCTLTYLDGSFPFWNGYPLLPHLSHDDGRKLDLNFLYVDPTTNALISGPPNLLGYGWYENPALGEINYPDYCRQLGNWQYGLVKYIGRRLHPGEIKFSQSHNQKLLRELIQDPRIQVIFIEPHLKSRLGLDGMPKLYYH